MATATHTGPIGIDQINSTFYVWGNGAGFSSVQAAVDYVRVYESGVGEIRIAYGHTGAENIGAVTGGTTSIVIIDLRFGGFQHYLWNGSQFVADAFDQLKGYLTYGQAPTQPASLVIGYDPNGFGTRGAGNIIVTANPGEAMPAFNITCAPQDGVTPPHTYIQCDSDPDRFRVVMNQSLELLTNKSQFNLWMGDTGIDVGSKGLAVYATASTNVVDFQGETISGPYDQTIRLQHLGGDVEIAPLGKTNLGTTLITGDLIFSAPAGHVGLPEFSIIAQPSDGGAAYTAMSFDTTTVPNNALMHFWESIVVRGVIASTANSFLGAGTLAQGGFLITWNLSDGGAETDFINTKSPNAGGFRWYNEDPNQTIDKTTLPIMYLNGANNTLYIDNVNVNGELEAGNVSADSAAFNTCLVANSPVRTFANSPDTGGGMEWPPAGIAVSTGTAWGTSINPATLQGKLTLTTTGTSGAATLAGNALNIPQYTAPAQVYPGAGLAVSTGTAWGAPIDPATVARTNAANTFTSNQTFNGTVATGANIASGVTVPSQGVLIGWNLSNGQGEVDLLGSRGGLGGGFKWFNLPAGFSATSATVPSMSLDANDSLSVRGAIRTAEDSNGVGSTASSFGLSVTNNVANNGEVDFISSRGSQAGGFAWYNVPANYHLTSATVASMRLDSNDSITVAGNAVFSGGNINIGTNPVLELRRDTATTSTINAYGGTLQFNTGVGGAPAIVINGTLYANGAKNFRIPHPLDETKELTHSCLEGPEVGVFYRGEVTTTNGIAEVTLPDYFEALTYPEDRSVLLTVIVDDANPVFGAGQIAAGRVKDGKFKVYSSDPSVTIAWEVKAVRRLNVERLQVVTNKPEPEPTATPQDEKVEA